MPETIDNAFMTKLNELGAKIDTQMATKAEVAKFAEQLKAWAKVEERKILQNEQIRFFGNKAVAMDFVEILARSASTGTGVQLNKESPFYREKGDLVAGADVLPTHINSVLSLLLAQGGVARKYCNLIPDVQGSIQFAKRVGSTTAAFTASGNNALVTPGMFTTTPVVITPAQISALSAVPDKTLWASAIPVATYLAIDMVEQAGVLEDNCVIKGDGSANYGGMTGLNVSSSIPTLSINTTGTQIVEALLALIPKVAESVQGSDAARFFMSGAIFSLGQRAKASTSGVFHFDPTVRGFRLGGYDVVVWHRMDHTLTDGKVVAYFGDLFKAVTLATGRDMAIVADRSYQFGNNCTAFRLTYDFSGQILQPSAMSRLQAEAASTGDFA